MRTRNVVLIGPMGAGKSTIARSLARKLGFTYIDTGAMYRAVGWKALHDGLPLDDEERITALAEKDLNAAFQMKEKQARSAAIDDIWKRVHTEVGVGTEGGPDANAPRDEENS